MPNIPAAITRALMRLKVRAPYDLGDMARDAVAVLDAAGIPRAHVVGVSMGGMIAQVLAAQHPERVRTLTSIMSSSGNPRPRVALGKRRALRALLRRPPKDAAIDDVVDHLIHVFGVIGSPGFPQEAECCVRTSSVWRAGGFTRPAPRVSSPRFSPRATAGRCCATIKAPTLVIHGADDPLVPVAAGRDTAAHIPDARLDVIAGMGHDFPPQLMTKIALDIVEHCRRAESGERQGEPEPAAATGLAGDRRSHRPSFRRDGGK